ncbi:UNVERIFIED_CONTAM: hypothetical protein HDU68_003745 [Siphonaria sp. JEL0065]|nr:hypothetical protein HDU68_003745 [Siphonaria sp. JEL0065]
MPVPLIPSGGPTGPTGPMEPDRFMTPGGPVLPGSPCGPGSGVVLVVGEKKDTPLNNELYPESVYFVAGQSVLNSFIGFQRKWGNAMFSDSDLIFISSANNSAGNNVSSNFGFKGGSNSGNNVSSRDYTSADVQAVTPSPVSSIPFPNSAARRLLTKEKKQRKRKIYIDSSDKNRSLYPNASDFTISWGRVFHNMVSVKLNFLEFPNVAQCVPDTANEIVWVTRASQQLGVAFRAIVPPGNYSIDSLATTLARMMSTGALPLCIHQPTTDEVLPSLPNFQVLVSMGSDTDVVSFTCMEPATVYTPMNPF